MSLHTEPAATYTFRATCPFGYEAALSAELKALGLTHVQTQVGFVAFKGGLQAGYRAMIRSRLASRILVVLARFIAQTADSLYADAYRFDWAEHIGDQSSFSLQVSGTNPQLRNTSFTALKIKDAIHDQYQDRAMTPPRLQADGALSLVLQVRAKYATLMVDLTGEPLIFRTYDADTVDRSAADLYALLLQEGGWFRLLRRAHPVLVCPTITNPVLAIEAAQQVIANAPGLARSTWAYHVWNPAYLDNHRSFDAELSAADDDLAAGEARQATILVAVDRARMREAEQMAQRAGVSYLITFVDHELTTDQIESALQGREMGEGLVIFDQTYASLFRTRVAERLSETPEYLASQMVHLCPNYACVMLDLGESDTEDGLALRRGKDAMTLKAYESLAAMCHLDLSKETEDLPAEHTSLPTMNQRIPLTIFEREGYPRIHLLLPSSEQFASRLLKRSKHLAKWARREDISCYRLYDADLPDYNLALDLYTSEQGERALQIFEYAPPKEVDEVQARMRLIDAAHIAALLLDIDPNQVYIKRRSRAKGGSQYTYDGGQQRTQKPYALHHEATMVVSEHGRRAVVNHADYLDTGLFLDTRSVRDEIERLAAGKRFLNLFAYTGTATVAAARGGARQSLTVDISATYLGWAEQNLKLNKVYGRNHRFERADVLAWISAARRLSKRFDLIYVDPPTFSNSARMKHAKFSVQEDHVDLLIGVSRLLSVGGLALFVTNDRRFVPNMEALQCAHVSLEDVSESFLPVDFERNRKIHKTYLLRRIVV